MSEEVTEVQPVEQQQPVTPVESQQEPKATEEVKDIEAAQKEPDDTQKQQDHEKNRIQKRIDSITRKRYEAEARAKILEEELNRYRAANSPQPVSDRPSRDQYASEEDFIDALTDWKLDQREQSTQRVRDEEVQRTRVSEWNKRAEIARKEYPDFDEALEDAQDVPIHQEAIKAAQQSDLQQDIYYYLAKHPEEAESTLRMSKERAAAFIGRLEEKISVEKASRASQKTIKKVSNAPPPIIPVKPTGSAVGHVDIYDEKTDVATFIRERNKQRKG